MIHATTFGGKYREYAEAWGARGDGAFSTAGDPTVDALGGVHGSTGEARPRWANSVTPSVTTLTTS